MLPMRRPTITVVSVRFAIPLPTGKTPVSTIRGQPIASRAMLPTRRPTITPVIVRHVTTPAIGLTRPSITQALPIVSRATLRMRLLTITRANVRPATIPTAGATPTSITKEPPIVSLAMLPTRLPAITPVNVRSATTRTIGISTTVFPLIMATREAIVRSVTPPIMIAIHVILVTINKRWRKNTPTRVSSTLLAAVWNATPMAKSTMLKISV